MIPKLNKTKSKPATIISPVAPLKLETIFDAEILPENVAPEALNPLGRFNTP